MAIIKLDIEQFKSEYVRLRSDYGVKEPVVNFAIMDEMDIWEYMLLRPRRRLRFGSKLANLAKSSPRPTEELGIARAFGFPVLDEDLMVQTQTPRDEQKWHCVVCGNKKPIAVFAKPVLIERFNAGLILASAIGHCCAECKRDKAKVYWQRAA